MKHLRLAAAALLALSAPLSAQQPGLQMLNERLDLGALQRIREEGLNNSRMDSLAQQLLDGIGSRLTASPGLRRAQQWASQTMQQWGLANVNIEPWDTTFGRGWERVSLSARMLEPVLQPLRAEPAAWSGSTRGTVTCPVVLVEVSDTNELNAAMGQRIRGACVMYSRWNPVGPEFEERTRRLDPESLLAWSAREPRPPQPQQQNQQPSPQAQNFQNQQRINAAVQRFIRANNPAVLLIPSATSWTYGVLRTGGHPDGRAARDSAYEPTPALYLSHEQYGQLYRLQQRGQPARIEVNMQNRWTNPDRREFNVVGEIPGTDLASQLVMIGAHFDSWHSGQGATDNGAGSLVMMEAMRILKTLNLPMRRTVRIALWSGEEQGLIGSRHYVRMHAAEMPNVSAYLNMDNGSGRFRGVYGQGNRGAMMVLDQIMSPFRDLGVVASRIDNTGGTDHLSFDRAGVPGFQFIQDPLEYGFRTHHSSVDTYERLVMDDLKQAATIVAWTVYTIANREDMMPRKDPPRPTGTN